MRQRDRKETAEFEWLHEEESDVCYTKYYGKTNKVKPQAMKSVLITCFPVVAKVEQLFSLQPVSTHP